ncbi:hypothetical protein KIPB_008890 [Kipferlia bialata]|uniref:Uncharacterized protein n=1 Tax=Kipferlia bialata TaxID=797122 RepID=A0A9K3D2C1_9EUKA|nr:hypothetical protein KIPB_008890 [Kipferlia bialata]|eukprot:g8890.t1
MVESAERLAILWTSGDAEVAENMVLMYASNMVRKGWWKTENCTLIIWGPSQRVLASRPDFQEKVKGMMAQGIKV